jgi:CRP-like cAMP-binding protein
VSSPRGAPKTLDNDVPTSDNHLIDLLPRPERRRFLAQCEPVAMAMKDILVDAMTEPRHAWFPRTGFVSLIASIDGKPSLEVGMVGREGMLGTHLALACPVAPQQALVQGSGTAWRIGSRLFRAELGRSPALQRVMNRYMYVAMAQLAGTAACLRFHQIGPRLARWLLMSEDRALSPQFHVTQEFLAYMLGVRRVGVTTAAAALQRQGLITYRRGELTVNDRAGLELAACSCYAVDRGTYHTLLG